MRISRNITRVLLVATTVLIAVPAWAQQRVQFSSPAANNTAFQPAPTTPAPPPLTNGGLAPVTPPTPINPGAAATLGQPTLDPFSASGAASPSPYGAVPSSSAPALSQPPAGYPAYQPQSPYLFPNGLGNEGGGFGNMQPNPYLKLIEDLRFRYTWLAGDGGTDLDINDVEFASTINIPNFFYSGQPVAISPIFAFHFWDGPDTSGTVLADLPSKAYSALLDLQWNPKFTPQLSGEFNGSIGLYTDFQSFTIDTIRFQGTALLVFQMTPTITLKGGATYLDRVDVKMLPAGGVLWRPNEQTYFDIYFPKPKLAHYFTTLGNTDIWWYLGGEYGGGSWTIERVGTPAFTDRIDINDIRIFGGLEWTSKASSVKGFAEIGFVFNREVVYTSFPTHSFNPSETYMLRAGLSY